MDPESPLPRPVCTDRPLFLDDVHPGSARFRPGHVAALVLGLVLAVIAAALLTLGGPRSPSRPAPGAGVTASAALPARDAPRTTPALPEDPDVPLPEPAD